MFRSLRSKLIAAFALVIFLTLFLAGSAFVFLLRDYQAQLALDQLADLALPLSYQVVVLERAGADSSQIGRFLEEQAAEVKVRMLLVDARGLVLEDTEGALRGQQLRLQEGRLLPRVPPAHWGIHRQADGQELFFVATSPRSVRPFMERFAARAPSYGVVLAVPAAKISAGWWRLVPMLSVAATISLLISIAVAYVLARSIAGPIAEMTRASEQMSRGNYDQFIKVRGQDEVSRLADTFNRMARQVALSHRTLRDFLANVSHELRTPLTSIQGFSQAMVDGAIRTPQGYAEAGQIIIEETSRMRRLVDDLLALSRLESGQIAMELQRLDLADLLRAAVRRMHRQAEERGVEIKLQVQAILPVQGDAHWLEQVFANLLDNAVRHTPAGADVTVCAWATSGRLSRPDGKPVSEQSEALVSVHNVGSYIPPEDLPRVFERFYQVDKSRANGGSGLGLAIVREVVQAHGGTVEAASDPKTGTTFVVSLPIGGSMGQLSPGVAGTPRIGDAGGPGGPRRPYSVRRAERDTDGASGA